MYLFTQQLYIIYVNMNILFLKTSAEVDSCKLLVLNVVVWSKYVKNQLVLKLTLLCIMSLYYNVMNVIYWNTFVIDIIKLFR